MTSILSGLSFQRFLEMGYQLKSSHMHVTEQFTHMA